MTSLAMFFSFLMLIVGGYGFSSTKIASLNIPLMDKIAHTVHSWAFLNPLLCGILLFAYAVFSVSKFHAQKALQITLAILCVFILVDASSIYFTVVAFVSGAKPTLETLLLAESGLCSLVFALVGLRKLRTMQPDPEKPSVDSRVHEVVNEQ